jgi:hypothetical protein
VRRAGQRAGASERDNVAPLIGDHSSRSAARLDRPPHNCRVELGCSPTADLGCWPDPPFPDVRVGGKGTTPAPTRIS